MEPLVIQDPLGSLYKKVEGDVGDTRVDRERLV